MRMMKRFHEKVLDCCDLVIENVLVYVCLDGMIKEYIIYLENLSFSSFSKLVEAARRGNRSLERPQGPVL